MNGETGQFDDRQEPVIPFSIWVRTRGRKWLPLAGAARVRTRRWASATFLFVKVLLWVLENRCGARSDRTKMWEDSTDPCMLPRGGHRRRCRAW